MTYTSNGPLRNIENVIFINIKSDKPEKKSGFGCLIGIIVDGLPGWESKPLFFGAHSTDGGATVQFGPVETNNLIAIKTVIVQRRILNHTIFTINVMVLRQDICHEASCK